MHSEAAAYADRLVSALAAAGVSDIVVCPGSRSQAIALAAARLARAERLAVHVRIDERDAGFLALGLARETGAPVAIVVTSGTAVANLHPAMLEAHHADVPLIAITADRPAELHGIRANQTTRQPGIFQDAARLVLDVRADALDAPERDAVAAVRAALGWRDDEHTEPGPVQLNVAVRDPLSGGEPAEASGVEHVERPPAAVRTLGFAPRTLVVAGADAGPAAAALAIAIAAPLIAEPSSSARTGPHLVAAPRAVLATGLADEVERVVVVGHPTLARDVTALIRRPDVRVVTIGRRGLDNVRGTGETSVLTGRVEVEPAPEGADDGWVARWLRASHDAVRERDARDAAALSASRADYARAELAAARAPVTRAALAEAVWGRTWPGDRLVLGASRLIRELDAIAVGKPIRVHANRGLAGIDGTIATAMGIALAHDRAQTGMTRVLVGDLTLLHDVGGLLVPPGEPRPNLQIVVGNDGGGSIFELLEVAGTADADDFERVLRTPQAVDIAQLAAAYGWAHEAVHDRAGLARALSLPGPCIVEVALADERAGSASDRLPG